MLKAKCAAMSAEELDREAAKVGLSREEIAKSDYYRQHPDKIPSQEDVVKRIIRNVIDKSTTAGRFYCQALEGAPMPAAEVAVEASIPAPAAAAPAEMEEMPPEDMFQSQDKLPF